MLTLITLVTLMILIRVIFRKFLNSCEWDIGSYILMCIMAFFISSFIIFISSVEIVNYSYSECPLIQINGKYFTTTTDRYGALKYNFAYREDKGVFTVTADKFVISDTPKIVFTNKTSKLGLWGFPVKNPSDYKIHVTPDIINLNSTSEIK